MSKDDTTLPPDDTPEVVEVTDADRWRWWAGDNEEEYRLAGPCRTRASAIDEAYGDTEPGDRIYLIEAVAETEDDGEGLYAFIETRNRSSVIRKKDKPLAEQPK